MSSIDERIVSIKFNNSQFEAGIKTTLSSLDGLKKTLNFSAGITALGDLDSAGKKVNLKFDSTGFDTSVKNVVDSSNALKNNLKFDGVAKGLSDLDAAGKKVNLNLDPTPFQNGAKGVVDAANVIKQNLTFESAQRGIGNLKSSVQNFSFQSLVTGSQNAIKSLGDLDLAGKAVSFIPIEQGAERAKNSISMMSVAGIAAIATLAAKAVSVGAEMAKSLFIDPAKSGLAEYELNLGSIQTILANTQSKGSTLGDVNASLDELNAYSDKTIYNFAEMAKNIGTFTSAGVGLKDSTAAIKGISNLAALSGSNSEQASTAMYQLSQAMSSGSVKLQDWNSVVNAGMGGEVFQTALKETARNQGKNVDALIAKNGSFRESLQEGWLTDKVMMETLSKMTGDLSDEQLKAMGYNDEQIAGIQKMAATASDAATKIKTFSQLTGTLTEITGSGWATSWKLILGDFEQAKVLWTDVYKVIGTMVQGTADARNKMLGDWNAAGGRQEMIWAVGNAFKALLGILNPIKDAFRSVFPPTTGKQLFEITKAIRIFTEALLPTADRTNLIFGAFKLLFTIIKIGVDIIKGALSVVWAFWQAFATGGDSVKGSMKPLIDGMTILSEKIQNSKFVENFFLNLAKAATIMGNTVRTAVVFLINLGVALFDTVAHIIKIITWSTLFAYYFGLIGDALDTAGNIIGNLLKNFDRLGETIKNVVHAFLEGGLNAAIDVVKTSLSTLGNVGDIVMTRINERLASFARLGDAIGRMYDAASAAGKKFWDKIEPLRTAVAKLFYDLGQQLKNVFSDVNFSDTLDMVNTGLLVGLVVLFKTFFKKILGIGDGAKDGLLKGLSSSVDGINKVLEGLSGTLEAMQQNLKADTLIKIAIAIGIMTVSIVVLSMIDSGKLTKGLVAIGFMVAILAGAMKALDKISVGSGFLKIPFIAASMILLAVALTILTIPVLILSRLSWSELIKGLGGVAVLLFALSKATESMAKNPADLIATGVGLMAIAIAVKLLADAVVTMGNLSFGELIKGLGGVSIVLFALSKTVESMAKNPADLVATGISLIAIAIGIKILASAVGDFGAMDIGSIIKGLASLAIVLTLLQRFSAVVQPKDMIQAAVSMTILAVAMKLMASAVGDFGNMSWEELAKGLIMMVLALDAMSKAMARVPPNMLSSAIGFIAVGIALKIVASALQDFAGMSWEEIGKGMVVLGGSMILLSLGMAAMSGSLAGSAALLVAAVALAILVPPLQALGAMSWEQIGMGMAALAAVFIIFGLAGLLLAPIAPVILALGTAMALFGAGLMAVGIGTVIFITGMIALTAAAVALGPALTILVMSLLALIPMAMEELGKGIVAFAAVIGNAAPTFLNAFVALLNTLLTAIQMVFPNLMATLWMVIVGLVSLLVRGIPLFVDAGMKIIIGILTGIGNNMGQLVDAGAKVIVEFINGIARNIGQITQAAANLIVKFVEGLAASVRSNSERMASAGADLAGAIIDGMANGVAQMAGRVLGAIGRVAQDALDKVAHIFDSHSPSKEFAKLGGYASWGLAVGIEAKAKMVDTAMSNVAYSALDVLKQSMSNIDSVVGNSMDLAPTIRPVLDLSSVKRDSGLVAGMIQPPTLALRSTYNKAATLSLAARDNKSAATLNSTTTESSPAPAGSINMVQNNYSPKELSAADIYRNTNNQLSVVKGALKTNA